MGPHWLSARQIIKESPILRSIGAGVTRALTSHPACETAIARKSFTALYLFGKRLAEEAEQALFRERVRPGMTVFDVGANLGFYTELLSRLVGPCGSVYAFEPDPFCASILQDRVDSLPLSNVHVERAAVMEVDGTVDLYCSRRDRAESRTFPFERGVAARPVPVRAVSLDSFCREHEIGRIDGIKIDVEGVEVRALNGMEHLLKTAPPSWMLLEFSPRQLREAGATPETFWSLLTEAGYSGYAFDADDRLEPVGDTALFSETYVERETNVWAVRGEEDRPRQGAKTRIVNDPGTTGGRGRGSSAVGEGVGPKSAVTR